MRPEVQELVKLGPLPSEADAVEEQLDAYGALIDAVDRPIADDEARALITLFGPDDCFGLAWDFLHLIETAPGWPLEDVLQDDSSEWVLLLKQRLRNAGRLPSSNP